MEERNQRDKEVQEKKAGRISSSAWTLKNLPLPYIGLYKSLKTGRVIRG